ncbi:DMT family transporter [Cellulomonas cellasea]|uniref:Drug/metabolite transporter (DMT)-like permease n=1 Tax=Cellulomonas cellasea TaxID=43670 RepID=A0A7W4UJ02_9CELL|nr:DMT family transporter [Cellulomonas cellasea]MBB2925067.1 drug/metabolite transporter (DMT)-like permease [Cellulomonas cellasea]
MSRRGWVLLVAVGVIWGVPYLLIKVAVEDVTPPLLVLVRTALGAVVLLPFALRGDGLRVLRGRWRAVTAFAALEIVGPWVLLSNAERTLASSTTGLLVATVPIMAVVLGRLVGDRRPVAGVRWAGLAVGLAGVAVLAGPGSGATEAWPLAQVLLAALGYAAAPIIAARSLQGVPAVTLTAVCLSLSALVYLPVVLLTGPHPMPGPAALGSLAALGLVCTAVAFVLFFRLISEVGAARSTLVAYINPLVAVALGAVVLDEPITAAVVAASVLIVTGSAAASVRGRPRRGRPVAASEPAAPEAARTAAPG